MFDSIRDYAMFVLDHRGRRRDLAARRGACVRRISHRQMRDEPAVALFDLPTGRFSSSSRRRGAPATPSATGRAGGATARRSSARPSSVRCQSDVDELDGFVVVTHDVTERRDLEDRLRQSQKMEAIGQLAGGIAHDFNNLLTVDPRATPTGSRRGPRRRTIRAAPGRDEIQKAAERAARLTRQLLAFSRRQMLQPTVARPQRSSSTTSCRCCAA